VPLWHEILLAKLLTIAFLINLQPILDTMEKNPENEENKVTPENIADETLTVETSENLETEGKAPSELERVKTEIEASKDKYIRLYSEFENFRRRTAKEKIEMAQTANESVIKSLLPVLDDFERAEKAIQDKSNKDLEGYTLIFNKFKKVLDQFGVKAMDISAGSEFNADLHEAITQIPADEKLKGKIVDVVEKGYLLNDKVVRFAKVVIGS
jgi:molecular chaperone GrpE